MISACEEKMSAWCYKRHHVSTQLDTPTTISFLTFNVALAFSSCKLVNAAFNLVSICCFNAVARFASTCPPSIAPFTNRIYSFATFGNPFPAPFNSSASRKKDAAEEDTGAGG